MTMHPAIYPPPPPALPTMPCAPPEGCEEWPLDGEPASGVRPVIDASTAARLRAEWEREQAYLDTVAPAPWWRDLALDAEAGQ